MFGTDSSAFWDHYVDSTGGNEVIGQKNKKKKTKQKKRQELIYSAELNIIQSHPFLVSICDLFCLVYLVCVFKGRLLKLQAHIRSVALQIRV